MWHFLAPPPLPSPRPDGLARRVRRSPEPAGGPGQVERWGGLHPKGGAGLQGRDLGNMGNVPLLKRVELKVPRWWAMHFGAGEDS